MPKPLAVVAVFLRTAQDLDGLLRCIVSLAQTAPQADVLVVDDGSPATELVDLLAVACDELAIELVRRPYSGGYCAAVNVGMRRALRDGRDAVLVEADVEFREPGWLDAMLARTGTDGAPAAVVGARLLSPNGLLQHAGMYFSLLTRQFANRFTGGPRDLPEALTPMRCPVNGAVQLIRHECLAGVGLYDEAFRVEWADVDYCLRVFGAGRDCIYEPAACATHEGLAFGAAGPHEPAPSALDLLMTKHSDTDFADFVPAYS